MILDTLPVEMIHKVVTVLCDSEEDWDAQQTILSLCCTNRVCGDLLPRSGITENADALYDIQGASLRTRDTDYSADVPLLRHHCRGCESGGEIPKAGKQSQKSVLPPSSASCGLEGRLGSASMAPGADPDGRGRYTVCVSAQRARPGVSFTSTSQGRRFQRGECPMVAEMGTLRIFF